MDDCMDTVNLRNELSRIENMIDCEEARIEEGSGALWPLHDLHKMRRRRRIEISRYAD